MNRIMTTGASSGALALALVALAGCAGSATQSAPQATSQAAAAVSTNGVSDSVTGAWSGTLTDPQGGKHPIDLTLTAKGGALEGTLTGGPPDGSPQPIRNGKIERNKLSFDIGFTAQTGEPVVVLLEGTVIGNRIRGVHGSPSMPMDLEWEATRQ